MLALDAADPVRETQLELFAAADLPRVGIVMPLAEQRGGAEVALRHFLGGVRPELRERVHLCFLEDGPLAVDAFRDGFPTVLIRAGRLREPLQWWRCARGIARWCREQRLEVLLSWLAKAHLYAGPAALLARRPALWWQHGLTVNDGVDLLATLLPARGVLACSNAAATRQREVWSQRAPVRTIYPPVNLAALRAASAPADARRALGLPIDKIVIGVVARLQHWKGVHVLLDVASELLRERGDLYFVVVGGAHALEPDYAGFVERRVRDLGLEPHLLLAGHQPRSAEWLAAMDIVVSPSLGEPFGMAIVEAMALGKPVVATRLAGPLEIVTEGVDGLLVAPDDAAALATALRRLVAQPTLAARLGAAARERAAAFAVPRFVAEIATALREAVR